MGGFVWTRKADLAFMDPAFKAHQGAIRLDQSCHSPSEALQQGSAGCQPDQGNVEELSLNCTLPVPWVRFSMGCLLASPPSTPPLRSFQFSFYSPEPPWAPSATADSRHLLLTQPHSVLSPTRLRVRVSSFTPGRTSLDSGCRMLPDGLPPQCSQHGCHRGGSHSDSAHYIPLEYGWSLNDFGERKGERKEGGERGKRKGGKREGGEKGRTPSGF